MRKWLVVLLGFLLSASTAYGQISGQPKTLLLAANPVGGCPNGNFALNLTANTLWVCSSGAWQLAGGGGAVSFSAITTGTNATALHMGTGGSLDATGTGTIVATSVSGPAGMTVASADTGTPTLTWSTNLITASKAFSVPSLTTTGAGAFSVSGTEGAYSSGCGAATDYLYADSTNHAWTICNNNGNRRPVVIAAASTTTTQALFATSTSGEPAYRAIAVGDIPALGQTQCPTCVTGPDFTLIGGILGTIAGINSNNTGITWFSQGQKTNQYIVIPFDLWVKGLTTNTRAAAPAGQVNVWNFERSVGGTDTSMLEAPLVLPPNANGAYQSSALPRPFFKGDKVAFQLAGETGPASPTFNALTANIVGTTSQMVGVSIFNSIAGSTTVYTGPSQIAAASATNTTESLMFVPLPYATTAKNLCMATSGAQSNGTLVVTLRKATSGGGYTPAATALTFTILANATGPAIYCDTTNSVSFAAGDVLDWQIANNSASASATIYGISMELTSPGGGPTGLIVFATGTSALTSGAIRPFAAFVNNGTDTEANITAPAPRAFTAKNLTCYVTTAPGTNPAAVMFRKNAADTTLTLSITTATTGLIQDTTHSVSVANKDLFNINFNQSSGTAPAVSACTMEVD